MLCMKYFAILALAPFFILNVKAKTCLELAEGAESLDAYILAIYDHYMGNEEWCDSGGTEQPDEIYSDAIIMFTWAYC
eukprot:295589-Ditylum_brightwellii.AAC.1